NLTDAKFAGASLFGTQLVGAKADRADFTGSRIAGDFSKASLSGAIFDKADLSADMKNQSMGLMRGVLNGAQLDGASFKGTNLSRVQMEFANLRDASLVGAKLNGSEIAGVDFTGADVAGADFEGAEVTSARLLAMRNTNMALNLDKLKNADRAFRD
ncbi:MAG: pentapeptide repeat-containing protein, partial [Hyphomicrobiaceae bacterium]|nr:pentapeptide repeat-containing protein [Hyphomicrobiaceae bacterium]